MIYSFSFDGFDVGRLTATRYPEGCTVGGDWVCVASSDEEALAAARKASFNEWPCPEGREHDAFEVEFVDSYRLSAGKTLRAIRLQLGDSQTGFARRLSVSRVTINRWERGVQPVDETALNLARVLARERAG